MQATRLRIILRHLIIALSIIELESLVPLIATFNFSTLPNKTPSWEDLFVFEINTPMLRGFRTDNSG